MSISHHQKKGIEIFHMDGELNSVSMETINDILQPFIEQPGVSKIILNFKKVPFIDSLGIGTLASYCKTLQDRGGKMAFCELGENLRRVMMMTGLDRQVLIFNSQSKAVSALK
ncbi:STAS domain-containing protein [Deltaproteobacteria bacterium TL4]